MFGILFAGLAALTLVAWLIQPSPAPRGKIPLVWVSDDNPTRRQQIQLFDQLHPQCDLRLDPNTTGMEKVIVQSLASVGPDLFDCYDGNQLSMFVRSGIALDVTGQLKAAGIDVEKQTWSATNPNVELDGRIYGFPTNAAVDAMWFHKDLFDKAGVPYPRGSWKWPDFLPLAQRLTLRDANGKVTQYGLLFDWDVDWYQFVEQWGGRLYNADGTRCTIDSPQAIAGMQFMHDLIYQYHVMPSPVEESAMATQGGWGTGSITWFGAKKGAMAIGGRWWLNLLRSYTGLHLGAVECPYHEQRIFRGYGRATLVNSQGKHKKQALEFLQYESSKPYNDLVNHQADALAPVIKDCYTPEFLHDPDYPQEDFNAVWREVMKYGVPDQISPFANGAAVDRILKKQRDLIKADQKPAADAMHTAAIQIMAEMRETLKHDPTLRARYLRLTGGRMP